ncbi:hypothetical protein LCI18_001797 [Fusarium solani-melongenae]|uniref:Uncharacterized protein n=1 Tax=Fusarium solani subsp. cucurbitae TaxID=2747967 RepID=A0ACD3YPI2_FUSSC|nr:hypothetical protein LCI18_001797 [Fusarium solani-melongenae]
MGDPLSLAASIAGLISLADVTFKYVYKFAKSAKDAKDEAQTLSDQVNELARVLRVLEALTESLEADGYGFDPTLRNHYLGHCQKTLEKVQKRVSKALDSFNSGSRPRSLGRQLKWPFSTSETTALLNEISSHKATINLALSADSMRKLQLSLSKTGELSKQVTTIAETVKRIEINTLIEVDRKKQQILDFFMAVNPQANLETSVKLRHALTGLWLTESPAFEHWLHTSGSRLWLTGIPGAGKTVLAGSVIQEALTRSHDAPGTGAAFFFCDYKNPSTWKTTNILGAIASQLARQKEDAFAILSEYYDELHPPRGLPRTPDSDELRARISQMSEHFGQTLMVVDGLDECGDETEDVVDMLRQVADYSERVSMAVFSRDHFNIRIRLDEDFEVVHIAAHTEDVRMFVGAELENRIKTRRLQLNDTSIKSEIADILVNRAKGMFRWVVCQLDYLCDCAHDEERREALEKLPPDLPESYRRLLERISRASDTVQSMVHMCLSFIAFAEPGLTILQLRQAVSTPSTLGATLTERNMVTEEEILRRCSSLIRKSQDGNRLEFAHFTVQEFLENRTALGDSPGIDRYLISKQSSNLLLATQCLRFLQLSNFETELIEGDTKHHLNGDDLIRERNEHYPFYPYSATFWMSLTRNGLDDPTLFNLANSLFHPSKTLQFTSWSRELVSTFMDYDGRKPAGFRAGFRRGRILTVTSESQNVAWNQRVLDAGFRPLHMAAVLNIPEICSCLVSQGVPVNSRWGNIRPIDLAFASVIVFDEDFAASFGSYDFNPLTDFLPMSRRRNLTIESLIQQGARPSNDLLGTKGYSTFSITAKIALILGDVTPISYLLSLGVVPDERELSFCSSCFCQMNPINAEAKSSMLSLLRYLASETVCKDGWAKQLCSVVSHWCAEVRLSSSERDALFDIELLTAGGILPSRLIQALANDDVELVKRYLATSEIDVVECRHEGGTLLHLAARNDACDVFEFLIAAGCDPYCEDADGNLPIHVHHSKSGIRFYETLKRLGISLSNIDSKGMTAWHYLAQARNIDNQLFSKLIQLDRDGTARALQTRTVAGETLLSIVLRPKRRDIISDTKSWDSSEEEDLEEDLEKEDDEYSQSNESDTMSSSSVPSSSVPSSSVPSSSVPSSSVPSSSVPSSSVPSSSVPSSSVPSSSVLSEDSSSGSSTTNSSTILSRYRHDMKREKDKRERAFFSLLDICSELPDFWSNYGPVMGAVASLGSGNVVCRLVEVGAEFELAVEGTRTPLHELSPLMPLQGAQILRDAYHYSVEYRFQGQLPVEMYIMNVLREELAPNAKIIKILAPSGVPRSQDAEGGTLWKSFSRLGRRMVLTKLIDNVVMTMLGLGPMRAQKTTTELYVIAVDTVREMLRQTQYWVSARDSSSVHRFLKMAMRNGDLKMVRLLLEHEVDIHHWANGTSPIEEACWLSFHGKARHKKPMLQLLVDYCKSDKLNHVSPKDGLGLLHRLALRSGTTNTVWLMESLIQRGANVNALTRDEQGMSVLAFHLEERSLECVELLLKQGADPYLGGRPESPTALSIAVGADNVEFLRQAQTLSITDWGKSMDVVVRRFCLKEANTLHLASAEGSLACMRFLLGDNLIKIEDSRSREGWTPLHVSAYLGFAEITELLLSKGFHVMAENIHGQTPLHLAVFGARVSVAKLLRKHGAFEALNNIGERPRDLAYKRNLAEFVQFFQNWQDEVGRDRGPSSQKQDRRLAAAIGRAIQADDKKYCQNTVSNGCPIDVILPYSGATPLMLALRLNRPEIAEWFLHMKASPLKSAENRDWNSASIIEAAAAKPMSNPLLSAVVYSYYNCGGNLVSGSDFPLHHAALYDNARGIEIILQAWEKLESAAQLPYPDSTCRQILQTIVNRQLQVKFPFTNASGHRKVSRMVTALHVASWQGNKVAASILVEHGADVDCVDSNGWTPLIYARTVGMVEHLITLGASLAMACRTNPFSWLMSWSGTEEPHLGLISKLPRQLILDPHHPVICESMSVTPRGLTALRQLGCDLTLEDGCGRSLMHCIICEHETLQPVLVDGLGLSGTSPFPWHLDWYPFGEMAFLTTRFRHFQRRVPRETFQTILNLEPQRGWSPLCRAAALNFVNVMENCLEMGARVDYEGCSLGSALMLASACGSLEAVKLLVRRGASVCYFGKNGVTSCLALAGTEAIRAWLLSGRFMDQQRITAFGRG